MGTVKQLTSPFGSAECALLPCPGWDAEALFPSAALRVEGTWSVWGAVPGVLGIGNAAETRFCRRSRLPLSLKRRFGQCIGPHTGPGTRLQ